jgi:hypothetical protein
MIINDSTPAHTAAKNYDIIDNILKPLYKILNVLGSLRQENG